MKRTIRKGRIFLAAATAATLAACGDDGSADSDSDSSSGSSTDTTTTMTTTSSSTTTDGTGTTTTTTSTSTTSATSTTTGTGGSTGGTTGGSTGDGSTGGGTTGGNAASLTPEEVCPFPLSLYDEGEFTPAPKNADQSVFAGPQQSAEASGALVLYQGTSGDDQINPSDIRNLGPDQLPCIVAGDGDDFIELEYGETGEGVSFTTISGGTGQDTFAFRTGAAFPPFGANVPAATIVDFEQGEDRIFLDTADIREFDADEATVVIGDYDGSTVPGAPTVYVDNDDGEIWLAEPGEASESVMLLAVFESDADLVQSDIVVGDTMPGCPFKVSVFGTNDNRGFQTGEGAGNIFTGEATSAVTTNTVQSSRANDRVRVALTDSNVTACIWGGDGDDELESRVGSVGEAAVAVMIGGAGADRFGLNHDYVSFAGATTTARIGDFEPGIDTLVLNPDGFGVPTGEVGEAVMFMDNFDGSTFPARIVIDNVDGEVWYTDLETTSSLAAVLDGAPDLDANDLEFVSAPIP